MYGSVRGAASNGRPYRNSWLRSVAVEEVLQGSSREVRIFADTPPRGASNLGWRDRRLN